MGQCQFSYQLREPAAVLLGQIQQIAKEYGGEFQGDEKSGQLSLSSWIGTIAAEYTIDGDQLQLTVTEKPFLVGCATIDATIRQYLPALACKAPTGNTQRPTPRTASLKNGSSDRRWPDGE
ncbi:MAG: hypothetical protein ACUVRZ_03620 [Desulfobacca sp.]|uniref:hypothetical protein n=1 Tax=Desulfobacca sp. TaxID=2067990 RepID=UPI00404B2569